MNISILEQTNNRVRLEVAIEQSDYQDKVKKEINKASRTMNVPGFRKGKVPTQVVKKMVGEQLRVEAINDILSSALSDYMKDKELNVVSYPVPLESNSEELKKEDPKMIFDIALIPVEDMDLDFSGETFKKYEVTVSDEDVAENLEQIRKSMSGLMDIDKMEDNAVITGDVAELDGDVVKEDGIKKESVMIFVNYMKDDEEKAKFNDVTNGSIVIFNPYKAFAGEKSEVSFMLGIDKEEVESVKDKEFSVEIKSIRAMREPELNQEFFDRVFGEDVVKSEEEAKAKIRENLEQSTKNDANFLFSRDFFKFVNEERAPKLELADEVIIESHMNARSADSEKQFDEKEALRELRESLYLRQLAKKEELEVSYEEITDFTYRSLNAQFAEMGWNAPADILQKQTEERLKDENHVYNVENFLLGRKVTDKLQERLNLEVQTVTMKELSDLVSPKANREEVATEAEETAVEE
ncbi:MAG: trigger factor [Porphyromonas sp.]|nr:trigger factor [Porphyromonas sp.]